MFDIWKAFDQTNRAIVYVAFLAAGMPIPVLLPYMRYMEALQVIGIYPQGVGELVTRRASIPQGCPFSMLGISLLFVPWVRGVRDFFSNSMPRVLADDLGIGVGMKHGSTQEEVIEEMEGAITYTARYVSDLGAVLSASKCKILTNSAQVKRVLKTTTFPVLNKRIVTTMHARDLGAHVSVGVKMVGATCTQRMAKGAEAAKRVGSLPVGEQGKQQAIGAKVLTMGLYGSPATPVAKAGLAHLRATIAKALDPKASTNRSASLTFLARRRDLDPRHHVVVNRILAFRRMWCVVPELREVFAEILQEYIQAGHSACVGNENLLIGTTGGEREEMGPVGLLLHSLATVGIQ
eukprot:13414272-Alexandrium_andersonii.AAC.1